MSLMLITHDFGVVAGIVERVNVMYGGRSSETGRGRSAYSRSPAHEYTRALLDAVPRLHPGGSIPHDAPRVAARRSRCATCRSRFRHAAAIGPSLRSTACRSTSRRARLSAWSDSRAPGKTTTGRAVLQLQKIIQRIG